MKRHTLVLVFFLSGITINDTYGQVAVLSSGGDATSSQGRVSYSIGQVAYTSHSSQTGTVNAGVQQPVKVIMVGNEEPLPDVTIGIYPNPTKDNLIIDLSGEELAPGQLSFSFYDLYGKLLLRDRILNRSVTVPLDAYGHGFYLLKVSHNNDVIKTFKVIKTN